MEVQKEMIDICCDGGSKGNPGPSDWRVTDMQGNVLEFKDKEGKVTRLDFHTDEVRTNNYAELRAIYAAAVYLYKTRQSGRIYTDSNCATLWIKNGTAKPTRDKAEILDYITKTKKVIKDAIINHGVVIALYQWNTAEQGDIPADYHRK